MPLPEATIATCSSFREIRCSTIFAAIRVSTRSCKRLPAENSEDRQSPMSGERPRPRVLVMAPSPRELSLLRALRRGDAMSTRGACPPQISRPARTQRTQSLFIKMNSNLRLIVNGFRFELLTVRACPFRGDGPRFTIRRDRALAIGEHFSTFHCRDLVGVVVHNFVGRRVPGKVPLRLIRFAVGHAHPDAVRRFPILVHAGHLYLEFVLLLGVNDRRVLVHPGRDFRLRFIELPRPHVRIHHRCCHLGGFFLRRRCLGAFCSRRTCCRFGRFRGTKTKYGWRKRQSHSYY